KRYCDCCQPLHKGQSACSAEALMRSRFSAFALQLNDYLLSSWHPATRPTQLDLAVDTQWKRLHIISANNDTQQGSVHFKAYYQEQDTWHLLEETSKFLFENGHWFYHSGNYQPQILKPSRNDTCPCGSNKKFKKCCS
ncbi:MAG: SEC-C domain-containing protein, partial [Oleispira sp.]|nr:SEC-C domain-containing protein [Oleispira sp.]